MKALYKWFAYKLPIRSKLLISFSILVMVPILVLGIYSYQQSKENTERQIRSTMESNLARLTSELDTRFQREGSTVRFLAYNLTFRNALENSGASAMTMAQVMNTSVEPTFWYFIAGDSYVKGMEVYSTKVRDKIGNFLLPVNPTLIVTYGEGYYTFGDMFKAGVIPAVIFCVCMVLWVPFICGVLGM